MIDLAQAATQTKAIRYIPRLSHSARDNILMKPRSEWGGGGMIPSFGEAYLMERALITRSAEAGEGNSGRDLASEKRIN